MLPRSALAAALALATLSAHAATYTFESNYTQGVARWLHLGFANPGMQFGQGTGTLDFDPADLAKAQVMVTIPLDKFTTSVPDLDEHLRSGDFFDTAKYPTATFKSMRVEKDAAPEHYRVSGELEMHGVKKPVVLDAKLNFDQNALFRHADIVAMRDLDEEDPAEVEASKFDLAYISLDGDIGCLVNGAGLAMATMDVIKLYGGEPANFLDVGGGATAEKVTEAFKIMLKNPGLKAILVNIFGGIMKCDTIANGVIAAAREVQLKVPLVVRMKGTNEELGRKILAQSGLPIISADNMASAAEKVVAAAKGR